MDTSAGEECRTLGCKSRRIRKDCRRRQCKKHCIEAGGCLSPPHLVSKETACQDPISTAPNPAIPPSSSTNPLLSQNHPQQQQKLPPAMPATAAVQPIFSSHMSPIFTQQMAVEQELQAKRRTSEMARVENARRVKHTVIVYAWTQVSEELPSENVVNDRLFLVGECRPQHCQVSSWFYVAALRNQPEHARRPRFGQHSSTQAI